MPTIRKARINAVTGCLLGFLLVVHLQSLGQSSIPIGEVQGRFTGLSTDPSLPFPSPKSGQTVTVQGVVTQIVHWKSHSKGAWGFFLQNMPADSDQDPATSDGLFIHTGKKPTLTTSNGTAEALKSWTRIQVTGRVNEHYGMTELTDIKDLRPLKLKEPFNPSQLPLQPIAVYPPSDMNESALYWEALEGMLVTLPAQALVVSGVKSYGDDESLLWVVHPQHGIAMRKNPLHQRVFRDFHPLDDRNDLRFDNQNGFRMALSSLGLHINTALKEPLLPQAKTHDRIVNSITGPVFYSFGTYRVSVQSKPVLRPFDWKPAPRFPRRDEGFLIATLNCANLYDYRDDPADPCDFPGNPGNKSIRPPFNYLPDSASSYQQRIRAFARQIVDHLDQPDLLLLQEIEEQDCFPKPDGQNDILQDLIQALKTEGCPDYQAASDVDGADPRGIQCALLYRTSRFNLIQARADHFLLGDKGDLTKGNAFPMNAHVQNPKAFNFKNGNQTVFSRPIQIAVFQWSTGIKSSESRNLYILNNHFKSVPDQSIALRKKQALGASKLIAEIRREDPEALILLGGDLNTYPRPDEPIPSKPSDTLSALYDQQMFNLFDRMISKKPERAFTYVYQGESGVLDHLFVNQSLMELLIDVDIPHVNADWPDHLNSPDGFGCSDHDPVVALFQMPRLEGVQPSKASKPTSSGLKPVPKGN